MRINYRKAVPIVILAILGLIVLLPLLAPLFKKIGWDQLAHAIYHLYSFSCHQKASRSIFLFDEQCAWCTRDTFIWSSIFISTLVVFVSKVKIGISLKTALLFGLPMALDGGIQLIATIVSLYTGGTPFYESTNLIRAVTGASFGIGLSFYLFPKLKEEILATYTSHPQHPPASSETGKLPSS